MHSKLLIIVVLIAVIVAGFLVWNFKFNINQHPERTSYNFSGQIENIPGDKLLVRSLALQDGLYVKIHKTILVNADTKFFDTSSGQSVPIKFDQIINGSNISVISHQDPALGDSFLASRIEVSIEK